MGGLRRGLGAAGALALALLATPAWSGVGYEVVIELPEHTDARAVVRGNLVVRARAQDGVGDATFAAFDVRPDATGWDERRRTGMQVVEPARFLGRAPWTSTAVVNGEYVLEVRIWGEVPGYDPENANTFARARIDLLVDNPPPAPRVRSEVGAGSVRLAWRHVRSADRDDFYGYRIWVAPGARCPDDPEAYALAGEATTTTWAAFGLRPGRACYRVTAARSSPVTGLIDSGFSAPLRLRIPAVGSGQPVVDAPAAVPPASQADRPRVRTRDREGRFEETLPYTAPQIIAAEQSPPDALGSAGAVAPARTSGEETAHRVAAGLVLVLAAIHLRRFVAGAPR